MISKIFYLIKPFIPRKLQLFLRRQILLIKRLLYRNIWPIDETASKPPDGWRGWPEKKKFALILTHDVDTASGQEKSLALMTLEKKLGFRSSFNFVPERYQVSRSVRDVLTKNGFEVGVHGLIHDGKLYASRKIFKERSIKINKYLKDWKSVGFRSPAMHHNLDWIHDLNIEYDASTFDTDPFEPYPDGVKTIFPFLVKSNSTKNGYVELPYTLVQDFTLFIVMKEGDVNIWEKKLEWIVNNGGMALINTHPDYMNFDSDKLGTEEYPVDLYLSFLEHIKNEYKDQYWHVLPKELASFWRKK